MYYRKSITHPHDDAYNARTLCQTNKRGNELMMADIARLDPFQRARDVNRSVRP